MWRVLERPGGRTTNLDLDALRRKGYECAVEESAAFGAGSKGAKGKKGGKKGKATKRK